MRIPFRDIAQKLEDPFFEVALIGRYALQAVLAGYDRLGDIPDNFRISGWRDADDDNPIVYAFKDSGLGRLFLAATAKGLCFLGFEKDDPEFCLKELKRRFSKQSLSEGDSSFFVQAVDFCNGNFQAEVYLHLKGTEFQLAVWRKLMCIPEGKLVTYSSLGPNKNTARAIGTAVGDNPVSYIVPCHRVIRSDGSFRGYFWGTALKRLLLAYELQTR